MTDPILNAFKPGREYTAEDIKNRIPYVRGVRPGTELIEVALTKLVKSRVLSSREICNTRCYRLRA